MVCHNCQVKARRHGKDRAGNQRFRCRQCGRTFQPERERPLGEMRLGFEKAATVLNMLCEGMAVRAVSRLTGIHKTTILKLLVQAGTDCERFLASALQGVPVEDVQCDELWGYVRMKEKTKTAKGVDDPNIGDAYCFVALERHSKLVLAWHLGRRTARHTDSFVEKLERATDGGFQVTTDGFDAYPEALHYHLGTRTDYATLVKTYGQDPEGQRRYSPPTITGTDVTFVYGNPDPERVCTSHVERSNLTMRMQIRRLTRLTNAFSKCWRNHRAALALFFAWYNFCWAHRSLHGCTPAMAAGIARTPWTMADLLRTASR